jgi:hypothetical protein
VNAAASLKERVLASAAVTPSPTRPQWKRLAGGLLAVSVAMGIALFELAGGLAHSLAGRPIGLTVRLADGWGLGSAALTWWVARKSTPFVRSADALVALPLVCPALMLAWMSHFHGAYLEPPTNADWPCFLGTTAISATPVALSLWLRRGGEPRHPRALAASIACVCAAWAGVLVLLWCPRTSPSHVVCGHVAPLVLLSALGWLLGGSVLALRTPPVASRMPTSHGPGSNAAAGPGIPLSCRYRCVPCWRPIPPFPRRPASGSPTATRSPPEGSCSWASTSARPPSFSTNGAKSPAK